MPTNLHALIRYRTIDRCLQRTRSVWNWERLSEACREAIYEQTGRDVDPPGRTTILQDIFFMRSPEPGFNAPIEWDRSRKTYFYSEPNFSIFQAPLSDHDLSELRHALSVIRQFQGFDQLNGFEDLITRLEARLDLHQEEVVPVIFLENNPLASGLRWLDPLYQYTRRRQVLRMTYRPFDPDREEFYLFSPYLLKEYNNRWFLIGHNHAAHKTWTLALDRILDLQPDDQTPFFRDPGFDPALWFRDVIGVTVVDDALPEEIILKINSLQARYQKTKPLHHSQQILEENPDHTLIKIRVRPNYELEAALFALGENLEVVSPTWLRQRILQRAKALLNQYR